MVLQANTSILAATAVIFIKWHLCQIKEPVSHRERRFDSKVPFKTRGKHRYPETSMKIKQETHAKQILVAGDSVFRAVHESQT